MRNYIQVLGFWLIVLLFTVIASQAYGQVKVLPWNEDSWASTQGAGQYPIKYDKALHFGRGYLATEAIQLLPWKVTKKYGWLMVEAYNIGYEVYVGGMKPWDEAGLHTEGFSVKDAISDLGGVAYAKWKQRWTFKSRLMVLPVEISVIALLVELSK